MKHFFLVLSILLLFSANNCFSQITNESNKADKEKIEFIARTFLNSVTIDSCWGFSSAFVYPESLIEARERFLSMFKDSSLNKMGIVSVDSIQSMTPAQFYDYILLVGKKYMKFDTPKPEWTITGVEFKDDMAFLTYDVKGRQSKLMKFKKDNNEWKMMLSFESIF